MDSSVKHIHFCCVYLSGCALFRVRVGLDNQAIVKDSDKLLLMLNPEFSDIDQETLNKLCKLLVNDCLHYKLLCKGTCQDKHYIDLMDSSVKHIHFCGVYLSGCALFRVRVGLDNQAIVKDSDKLLLMLNPEFSDIDQETLNKLCKLLVNDCLHYKLLCKGTCQDKHYIDLMDSSVKHIHFCGVYLSGCALFRVRVGAGQSGYS